MTRCTTWDAGHEHTTCAKQFLKQSTLDGGPRYLRRPSRSVHRQLAIYAEGRNPVNNADNLFCAGSPRTVDAARQGGNKHEERARPCADREALAAQHVACLAMRVWCAAAAALCRMLGISWGCWRPTSTQSESPLCCIQASPPENACTRPPGKECGAASSGLLAPSLGLMPQQHTHTHTSGGPAPRKGKDIPRAWSMWSSVQQRLGGPDACAGRSLAASNVASGGTSAHKRQACGAQASNARARARKSCVRVLRRSAPHKPDGHKKPRHHTILQSIRNFDTHTHTELVQQCILAKAPCNPATRLVDLRCCGTLLPANFLETQRGGRNLTIRLCLFWLRVWLRVWPG